MHHGENLDDKLNSDDSSELIGKISKGDLSSVKFPEFNGENLATRKAWGPILDGICDSFDFLVGIADLEPFKCNRGFAKRVKDFVKQINQEETLHMEKRVSMGAINNGIAQHGV